MNGFKQLKLTRTLLSLALGCLLLVIGAACEPRGALDTWSPRSYGIDYNDGPHIFWQNDTTAVVLYYCEGELLSERMFTVRDTIRFAGLCADSSMFYEMSSKPPRLSPDQISGAPRIMAVSDIHGEYDLLAEFLRKSGVVDDDLHWQWGSGHLVVLGDIFDRGDQVTECLWMIYRLEQEARRRGGRVHMLLGNHELFGLRGFLRDAHKKYHRGLAKEARISDADLYGSDMELGRWLRSKPVALKIGDILFVHAGISQEVLDRGLKIGPLNEAVRKSIDQGSPHVRFGDLPKLLHGSYGPLWYRGFFMASEGKYAQATPEDVDRVLAFYGVKTVVVGHSEHPHVMNVMGERIYAIDVPVKKTGGFEGLLWKSGQFNRVTPEGDIVPLPISHQVVETE